MILKFNFKRLLVSAIIPLLVGGASALVTRDDMDLYSMINVPPLAPPRWIFPIMWTVLYILMGVSLYIVWNSKVYLEEKSGAIKSFGIQLLLNFIWSPIFFNNQWFLVAFIILVVLWIATLKMIIGFYKISKLAGLLQIPYLLWLSFAGYLNLAIYLLN